MFTTDLQLTFPKAGPLRLVRNMHSSHQGPHSPGCASPFYLDCSMWPAGPALSSAAQSQRPSGVSDAEVLSVTPGYTTFHTNILCLFKMKPTTNPQPPHTTDQNRFRDKAKMSVMLRAQTTFKKTTSWCCKQSQKVRPSTEID